MPTQQVLRGVVNGCDVAPQASPNRTVNAGAGWIVYDNVLTLVAANSTLSIPDPAPGSVSVIGIDSTGTWVVLNGTDPAAQSLIVPCYQAVETDGTTGIGASGGPILTDIRNLLIPPQPSNALAFTFLNTALSAADPGTNNFGFDTTNITTIAHMYLNYKSPSWATVTGTYLSLLAWLASNALASGYAPILKCWSRKEPNKIVRLLVSAVTNHSVSSVPTWADLTVTVLEATQNDLGAVSSTPKLSTDAFDTAIEVEGFVPVAPSLAHGQAVLGADVTLSTVNTYFDAVNTGTLPAGTYLVTATMAFGGTATHIGTMRLWDGTTTYAEAEAGIAANAASVGLVAVVTLSSPTTLKISGASDTGTTDKIKAAVTKNSAGNFATILTWVRIA